MPNQTMSEHLARQIADAVAARLGSSPAVTRPQVHPGAHEGSCAPFVVSWEEGPFQWSYRLDLLLALGEQFGVHLEPVNHFVVAVEPPGDAP